MATVQSGLDSNLNGDAAGDRVIFNPAGQTGVGSDVTELTNSAGAVVGYLANNPNAQYIIAGPGALATAGRNTLPTGHINNWDMTAVKRVNITERFKTEFQAQFLNVFNHPQFIPGRINRVDSTSVTSVGGFLFPDSADFANPKAAFSSNARAIQLALKFIF
jgi:hypothetical protein